jgi:hypothetical protein
MRSHGVHFLVELAAEQATPRGFRRVEDDEPGLLPIVVLTLDGFVEVLWAAPHISKIRNWTTRRSRSSLQGGLFGQTGVGSRGALHCRLPAKHSMTNASRRKERRRFLASQRKRVRLSFIRRCLVAAGLAIVAAALWLAS